MFIVSVVSCMLYNTVLCFVIRSFVLILKCTVFNVKDRNAIVCGGQVCVPSRDTLISNFTWQISFQVPAISDFWTC
jgi:hypothetical protein